MAGQFKQLDLAFAPNAFRSGDRLAFGVDSDEADQAGTLNGAAGGNSADLLGQTMRIPEGTIASGGARWTPSGRTSTSRQVRFGLENRARAGLRRGPCHLWYSARGSQSFPFIFLAAAPDIARFLAGLK